MLADRYNNAPKNKKEEEKGSAEREQRSKLLCIEPQT